MWLAYLKRFESPESALFQLQPQPEQLLNKMFIFFLLSIVKNAYNRMKKKEKQ